jgi:hypothetical protein
MKIVNRETLMKMPDDIVFMTYEPQNFGQLMMLRGACGNDFFTQDLCAPIKAYNDRELSSMCEKAERGEEVELDFDCAARDGMFDDKQLYAVYSKTDVLDLIKCLMHAV